MGPAQRTAIFADNRTVTPLSSLLKATSKAALMTGRLDSDASIDTCFRSARQTGLRWSKSCSLRTTGRGRSRRCTLSKLHALSSRPFSTTAETNKRRPAHVATIRMKAMRRSFCTEPPAPAIYLLVSILRAIDIPRTKLVDSRT